MILLKILHKIAFKGQTINDIIDLNNYYFNKSNANSNKSNIKAKNSLCINN